jgi:hypothetical protein
MGEFLFDSIRMYMQVCRACAVLQPSNIGGKDNILCLTFQLGGMLAFRLCCRSAAASCHRYTGSDNADKSDMRQVDGKIMEDENGTKWEGGKDLMPQ